MPRLESASTSPRGYLTELGLVLTPASPVAGRRLAHLHSLLLRSVRIRLGAEDGGLGGTPLVPLRVRPAFVVLNVLDLVLLGLLGFHPNGQAWTRLNDKVLHFICFFFATSLFYMIWDVDEAARRVWLWRNAALLLTFFTCFAVGSIGSEIVQSFLPYKTFDIYDVLSNMLGSSLGLFFTYHLELRYRARRELERLYDPLDVEDYGDEFDRLSEGDRAGGDDDEAGEGTGASGRGRRKVRFGAVWDLEDEGEPAPVREGKERRRSEAEAEAERDEGQTGLLPFATRSSRAAGVETGGEGGTPTGKRPEELFSIDDGDDEERDEEREQVSGEMVGGGAQDVWKHDDPLRS